jgi:hypothetical protein
MHYESIYRRRNAIFVIAQCHMLCTRLNRIRRIRHRHRTTYVLQHGNIIVRIANGHHFIRSNGVNLTQCRQRKPLAGLHVHKLQQARVRGVHIHTPGKMLAHFTHQLRPKLMRNNPNDLRDFADIIQVAQQMHLRACHAAINFGFHTHVAHVQFVAFPQDVWVRRLRSHRKDFKSIGTLQVLLKQHTPAAAGDRACTIADDHRKIPGELFNQPGYTAQRSAGAGNKHHASVNGVEDCRTVALAKLQCAVEQRAIHIAGNEFNQTGTLPAICILTIKSTTFFANCQVVYC